MSRPGGRLPAGDIRPPARQTRTSCGFCEGGHGQPRGVRQDVDGRCKGHLAGFRQGHQHQPRRLVDVRVLGRQGRHPAGSMCRFAVQSVLARPLWNISALARAEDAAHHPARSPGPGDGSQRRLGGITSTVPAGTVTWLLSQLTVKPAALPAGVTVRWLIPSPSWPGLPAIGFTPRSWAARLFRRSRGWAIRGASQPWDSCHRRKVWPVTSVTARVPGELLGRLRAPIRSCSLLRFQDSMP